MTDPARDLILGNPFSLTEFKTTDIGIAASHAIDQRAADIIYAADVGEPPVAVLIPALDDMICEGLYWRMVETMIEERLGSKYEKARSKPVAISCHKRGRCYTRVC